MKKIKYSHMAECNINSLLVSGAGITAANGTYTKSVTEDVNGYSRWTNEGGFSVIHGDPGNDYWFILDVSTPKYRAVADSTDCPIGFVWELMPFGSPTPPAPTVTEGTPTPSQPTFGLAADVVALITSRFGTVANFLRLRNQGQV
jgi:hypothetical protein